MKAMAESVDFYLAWCAERGKTPEKPFSGKFMVRNSPELTS
jgi:predicted HicB family RNase H-like nuclease